MLQIFINLPKDMQADAPFVFSVEAQDVPTVYLAGAKIRVPLGNFEGLDSPSLLPTDVRLLDISLEVASEVKIPVPQGHVAFVMPIDGEMYIDGQAFDLTDPKAPVNLPQGADRVVTLQAKNGNTKAVMFSGTPLNQPVFWQGPMALASMDALATAVDGYRRGEFGTLQAR